MGLPSFFRSYKYKIFDYKPLYYNENKEELENIIKNAELETGSKKSTRFTTSITRGSFREKRINVRHTNIQSTIRFLIILIVLLLLFGLSFYLYKTRF